MANKRVIETEKMMELLNIGTSLIKSMTEKEKKGFTDAGLFKIDEVSDQKYVSFVKFRGFVLGAAIFSTKYHMGIPYMEISGYLVADIGKGGAPIISRVIKEVELFALKKEVEYTSIVVSVKDINLPIETLESFRYSAVTNDNLFKVHDEPILSNILANAATYFKKITIKYDKLYVEGTFHESLMNILSIKFGRIVTFNLAAQDDIPFPTWDAQFRKMGNILENGKDIRFSKYIVRNPSEIIDEMMTKNVINTDQSLSTSTSKLIDILNPKVYDTRSVSSFFPDEAKEIFGGDIDDFSDVCRGQLGGVFVKNSLGEGDFTLTIEIGGIILAFCTLEISQEYINVVVLCSRPSIGLGSRILSASEDFTLKMGIKEVRLSAVPRREQWYAQQGYEKFIDPEEEEKEDEDDEDDEDGDQEDGDQELVLMRKILTTRGTKRKL